ncbi:MAG: prolipoprotein diacylglyceryl transferase [Alphaproteobacteria bacterium]|nr:prolipoprotein diacylglyceryl transferase [Alphaproteobacteria bacterium]
MIIIHEPSPIAFTLGSFAIHWYALSYLCSIYVATLYTKALTQRVHPEMKKKLFLDPFFSYLCTGIILGGRLGHVLFFDPLFYCAHPLDIIKIWEGGMSFHGGLIGTIFAMYWVSKRFPPIKFSTLCNAVATAAPLGLCLGRVTNYLNGELIGVPTHQGWGVVFTNTDAILRHPSQLYEAVLEGPIVWIIIYLFHLRKPSLSNPWKATFLFIYGYSAGRFCAEYFRTPDGMVGFLSLGQLYCLICAFFAGIIQFYLTKNTRTLP